MWKKEDYKDKDKEEGVEEQKEGQEGERGVMF